MGQLRKTSSSLQIPLNLVFGSALAVGLSSATIGCFLNFVDTASKACAIDHATNTIVGIKQGGGRIVPLPENSTWILYNAPQQELLCINSAGKQMPTVYVVVQKRGFGQNPNFEIVKP